MSYYSQTLSIQKRKENSKSQREKHQITHKSKTIRITAEFSIETLKARRAWNDVLPALKENICQHKFCIEQSYLS
jgi:hypothetical protein